METRSRLERVAQEDPANSAKLAVTSPGSDAKNHRPTWIGEVKSPGRLQVSCQQTPLMQAILAAGGVET